MPGPSEQVIRGLTVVHAALILIAGSLFGAGGLFEGGLRMLAVVLIIGVASIIATRYVLAAGRRMSRLVARGAWAGGLAGPLILFAIVLAMEVPSAGMGATLAFVLSWGLIPAALIGAVTGAALGLMDALIIARVVDETEPIAANR